MEAMLLKLYEIYEELAKGGVGAIITGFIFGNELHYGYDAFTVETTNLFAKVLNIRPDHIYIKYEDIIAWGVQGMYIDRNQYR